MEDGHDDDEPFVFRLNDNGSGPSVLVKVCAERGWRMYQGYNTNEEKWNLWWRTSVFPAACYKSLSDWQFMNHIPKGGSICRKDNLSRLLRCMRRIYGSIYDFSPPCFHLPLEYAKLVSECSRLRRSEDEGGSNVVWIHKPVAQSQGRGIFLFRSICDMRCGSAAVVQRYIERPLLIAGYKFDLRLYVCVPGYRPLTAYMYAEGLARFGTDKYTLADIHNPYRHLTNSSLNKSGPRYAECKELIGSGCKWTLKQVRRALVGRWGAAEWLAWQRIRALVTLTLLAQAAGTPPARNCFEFYGFDVLLDDSLKPWLIEVNLSPALGANCEADVAVKQPMLHELFDLLGLPMRHTGLSQLQGPPQTMFNSCSSEDESGVPRAPARAPTAVRRPGTRRRRTIALNCVDIQPPMVDKFMETADRNKELNSGRLSKPGSELTVDSENHSASSVAATPTDQVDESWRGGYATAASRRRMLSACAWGNGIRWDRAVGRVGHWVRIYPHTLPADDQLPMEDARESVAHVSRFVRSAREVAREGSREPRAHREEARDTAFEVALRKKLACGPHFQDQGGILKMDKGLREKTEPFDSFIQIFKVLTVAGFAKLFKPRNHCAEIMHKVYRLIVVFIVFTYNLQHCVYVWQMRDHAGKFIEGVILEIPEFVLCLKVLVMYFESRRFDKLVELIKDPIFEAKNKEDEKYIKENNKAMQKLSKFTLVGLSSVGVFWIITPILKRMSDETVNVPSYMPFKTDTWPRFLLAIFFDTSPVLWIGYGHFHIDCLIASFYSQARSQIKIMKYNLEHLFDDAKTTDQRPANFKFLDLMDETIQGRFVHYVRRYESVVWFTNEVTDIFGKAISFQFLMTSFSTCLVVYQMSSMSTFSVEFVFFMGYYLATQFQIFIYCYYGGLVEYESKFIIDSLYLGEWLSLSPKFRKQVVIAMSRWIRPITPRVSGIVPLSLTTFLTITRSAYTLYTVLKTSNNKNSGERTLAF